MPRKCASNPNKKNISKRESPKTNKRKDSPKFMPKISIKISTSGKDKAANKKKTNPIKSAVIHRKTTASLDRNNKEQQPQPQPQQQQPQQHGRRKSSTLVANKSSNHHQHGDGADQHRNNPHHPPQLPDRVRQLLRNKGYTVIRYIDRGSTSYVYKVRKGGQFFAAKVMDHSRISKMVRQQFLPNELRIVREIKHMFIVETFDVIEEEGFSILINEYANHGDLISFIESISKPDIPLVKRWIKQIARALAYLHSKGIAHRDVKADNVLLCNGIAKLSDFTYSQFSIGPNGEVIYCNTFCGTIEYKAPETLLCDQPFDPFIADCFSFGVLIYTLVTLEFPFGSGSELRTASGTLKLYQDIQNKNWKPTDDINNDRKLYSLLKQLLNPDTSERITMNQVLAHPWFG